MKKSLLIFLLGLSVISMGQRTPGKLNLHGSVLGYTYDPSSGWFKKNKQIEIEGSVAKVKVSVSADGKKIKSTRTNTGGEFSLGLDLGHHYLLEYTKENCGISAVNIDLTNIPDDLSASGLVLRNVEFILNHFQSDKPVDNGQPFGTIYFNSENRQFEFEETEFEERKKLFKKGEENTPLKLMLASLERNKYENRKPKTGDEWDPENIDSLDVDQLILGRESLQAILNGQTKINLLAPIKDLKDLSWDDLELREDELAIARDQLEKDKLIAVTENDFLLIKAREELLDVAQSELAAAKEYIKEQESKIKAQQWALGAAILTILLLAFLAWFYFKTAKAKKKTNQLLKQQHQKIQESINYAERIQRSALLSDDQIKNIVPDSFVYFEPLDIVSGDFFWFAKVSGQIVVAAVDCTGHGVPGAFMSLIGNTMLNQIVLEKKILQPGQILSELHKRIINSLHKLDQNATEDGMDMSICVIDPSSRIMKYAGAMNPVYVVENEHIEVFTADLIEIGGKVRNKIKEDVAFSEKTYHLGKDAIIYLFSDGYMDQFGGEKDEKFNVTRFQNLLKEVQHLSMSEQKEVLSNSFQEWKGDKKQLDDVCVIGVKF